MAFVSRFRGKASECGEALRLADIFAVVLIIAGMVIYGLSVGHGEQAG